MSDTREKLIKLIKHCTSCEVCRDADIADHLIANGVTVQEWVPVAERLPALGERVLIFNLESVNQYTSVCFLEKDEHEGFWWCECGGDYLAPGDVTHWMPLPEPPKED